MPVPINERVASRRYLEFTWPNLVIGAEKVPGIRYANLSGCNKDIDTASLPETMWPGSNLYPWPTAQFQAYVVSTSSNDTSPSGSGARTVLVAGLTINYAKRVEIFTLTGTAPVASAYNDWYRINSAIVLTAAPNSTNVGTINITQGSGGTILGIIDPGMGLTQQGTYTSDENSNATLLGGSVEMLKAAGATEMQIALFFRVDGGPWFDGINTSIQTTGSSAFDTKLLIPQSLPPKSDIDIRIVHCDSPNVRANMNMYILLTDTDILTVPSYF